MFCKYCGKSIPDGSQVCTYCGQRLTKMAAAQPEPEETYTEQEPKKKNTGMVTLIIFMAGLILVLIVALIMSNLMSKAPEEPDKGKTQVTEATAGDVTEAEPGLPADNIYAEAFQGYEAYVLPGSDSSYKCYTDIEALTEEALMVAEQEIYARHGQKFSDADLQAYFEGRSWYTPGSGSFTPNGYEQANLDLIRVYRAKQDGSLYRSGNGYINAFSKTVDYALPNSSARTLDGYDIDHLTEAQLCVARNEILARHGWLFEDKLLREYFYSKEWYKPSIPGKQFDYSVLSSAEQANISLIQVYEKRAEGVGWSSDNPYKAVYFAYGYQDFIFYNSSSRYLTEYDLAGMTEDELCIARNEIFARNGYTFQSKNLSEYFLHHHWYFPQTTPGGSVNFSDIENANIELIADAEEKASKSADKIFYPDYYYYW